MRKLLLFGLGCALATSAAAQTEKGARFIGANVGNLSYSREDKSSSLAATLTPSAGIFIANNLLLGTGLPLTYARQHFETSSQEATRRETAVGLSPFARYYLPGTGAHRFFGQLQAAVIRDSYRYTSKGTSFGPGGQLIVFSDNQRFSNTASSFGASLGYSYFLTPGVALEIVAAYNRYSFGNYGRPSGYSFYTGGIYSSSGALDISAGFAVFLPSRKVAAAPTE